MSKLLKTIEIFAANNSLQRKSQIPHHHCLFSTPPLNLCSQYDCLDCIFFTDKDIKFTEIKNSAIKLLTHEFDTTN